MFEKQPSPNLECVIQELEHEAAALRRLKRTEEALAAEERIKVLRKAADEIPSIRHDGDGPIKSTEGALLVELDGGLRGMNAPQLSRQIFGERLCAATA